MGNGFKKGHIPWNKGISNTWYNPKGLKLGHGWNKGLKGTHFSPKTEFKKGQNLNEQHFLWKGENASYSAKHYWISRKLGKPRECTNCGTKNAKKFEWANLDGEYKRNLDDYMRLCTSCHRLMDGHSYKAWQTRRNQLCQV